MMQQQQLVVPDQFEVKQKLLTVGLDMHLKHNDNTFGKVIQRLSFGEKYELTDMNERVVAVAKEKLFKLGTHYEIMDPLGAPIGSFDHELMKSLFSIKSKYCIKDQHGVPRLFTEELDFFGTDVKIFDGHKNLVAEMSKPMFSFRQKWQVRIYGPVDRRIIAFVPSFLSAIQRRKASDYDGF